MCLLHTQHFPMTSEYLCKDSKISIFASCKKDVPCPTEMTRGKVNSDEFMFQTFKGIDQQQNDYLIT